MVRRASPVSVNLVLHKLQLDEGQQSDLIVSCFLLLLSTNPARFSSFSAAIILLINCKTEK